MDSVKATYLSEQAPVTEPTGFGNADFLAKVFPPKATWNTSFSNIPTDEIDTKWLSKDSSWKSYQSKLSAAKSAATARFKKLFGVADAQAAIDSSVDQHYVERKLTDEQEFAASYQSLEPAILTAAQKYPNYAKLSQVHQTLLMQKYLGALNNLTTSRYYQGLNPPRRRQKQLGLASAIFDMNDGRPDHMIRPDILNNPLTQCTKDSTRLSHSQWIKLVDELAVANNRSLSHVGHDMWAQTRLPMTWLWKKWVPKSAFAVIYVAVFTGFGAAACWVANQIPVHLRTDTDSWRQAGNEWRDFWCNQPITVRTDRQKFAETFLSRPQADVSQFRDFNMWNAHEKQFHQ